MAAKKSALPQILKYFKNWKVIFKLYFIKLRFLLNFCTNPKLLNSVLSYSEKHDKVVSVSEGIEAFLCSVIKCSRQVVIGKQ